LLNIQTDSPAPQTAYNHSMNGWLQVNTEVKFNCTAAMPGAHHFVHLICQCCHLVKERIIINGSRTKW